MSDSTIAIDEPSTIDKRLDTEQLTVNAVVVQRERIQVAGATDVAIAAVVNAEPTTQYGVVVRNIPSGTQPISGTVTIGTFPDNEPFNVAQYGGSAVGATNAVH